MFTQASNWSVFGDDRRTKTTVPLLSSLIWHTKGIWPDMSTEEEEQEEVEEEAEEGKTRITFASR